MRIGAKTTPISTRKIIVNASLAHTIDAATQVASTNGGSLKGLALSTYRLRHTEKVLFFTVTVEADLTFAVHGASSPPQTAVLISNATVVAPITPPQGEIDSTIEEFRVEVERVARSLQGLDQHELGA